MIYIFCTYLNTYILCTEREFIQEQKRIYAEKLKKQENALDDNDTKQTDTQSNIDQNNNTVTDQIGNQTQNQSQNQTRAHTQIVSNPIETKEIEKPS